MINHKDKCKGSNKNVKLMVDTFFIYKHFHQLEWEGRYAYIFQTTSNQKKVYF